MISHLHERGGNREDGDWECSEHCGRLALGGDRLPKTITVRMLRLGKVVLLVEGGGGSFWR